MINHPRVSIASTPWRHPGYTPTWRHPGYTPTDSEIGYACCIIQYNDKKVKWYVVLNVQSCLCQKNFGAGALCSLHAGLQHPMHMIEDEPSCGTCTFGELKCLPADDLFLGQS